MRDTSVKDGRGYGAVGAGRASMSEADGTPRGFRQQELLSLPEAHEESMRILSGHGERHDRVAMKGIEMYRECWADPEVRAVVPGPSVPGERRDRVQPADAGPTPVAAIGVAAHRVYLELPRA